MFCNDCGTRNSVDSKYCKECGSKVNDGYRTMMLTVDDLAAVEDDQGQQRLTRLLDMAFWHNEAGHTDAALRAAEAALKIHPLCTTAHSLLGTLYERKGDDDKAIEHFEEVVRLNPDSEADAAKLEQVRRGVHVKAIAQPATYKWLPPALAGLSSGTLPGTDWKQRLRKPNPALASGAAALLVLTVGWAAIKESTPPASRVQGTSPTVVVPAPVTSVTNSSFAAGMNAAPNPLPAPIVLPPRTAPGVKVKPVVPQNAVNGPFGEALAPGLPTAPLVRTPRRARSTSVRVASRPRVGGSNSLPALNLRAVPLPSAGLAPMPISGIAPALPTTSVASMPQHTVVVSRLASASAPPLPSPPPDSGGASSANSGSPSPRISIRINSGPTSESISISDHSSPVRHTTGTGGGDGDSLQQSAWDLQNQGDFRRARSTYQKAIHAYKSQIASGHDTDTAKRGLQSSQTGLQICEQSQP